MKFPIGKAYFQGIYMLVLGRVCFLLIFCCVDSCFDDTTFLNVPDVGASFCPKFTNFIALPLFFWNPQDQLIRSEGRPMIYHHFVWGEKNASQLVGRNISEVAEFHQWFQKKRILPMQLMILRRFTRMVGGWQWMMLMVDVLVCFCFFLELSNKKKGPPGCLGYTGDEILPSYVGIKVNHYKDPVIKQPGFRGSSLRPWFFFRGWITISHQWSR